MTLTDVLAIFTLWAGVPSLLFIGLRIILRDRRRRREHAARLSGKLHIHQ